MIKDFWVSKSIETVTSVATPKVKLHQTGKQVFFYSQINICRTLELFDWLRTNVFAASSFQKSRKSSRNRIHSTEINLARTWNGRDLIRDLRDRSTLAKRTTINVRFWEQRGWQHSPQAKIYKIQPVSAKISLKSGKTFCKQLTSYRAAPPPDFTFLYLCEQSFDILPKHCFPVRQAEFAGQCIPCM